MSNMRSEPGTISTLGITELVVDSIFTGEIGSSRIANVPPSINEDVGSVLSTIFSSRYSHGLDKIEFRKISDNSSN